MDTREENSFLCPYCASNNTLLIDFSAGKRQEFIIDCEICCRPITIKLEMAGEDIIDFKAEKENE